MLIPAVICAICTINDLGRFSPPWEPPSDMCANHRERASFGGSQGKIRKRVKTLSVEKLISWQIFDQFYDSMAISKIIGQNKNLGKNMSLSPFVGHDLVKRELGRIKLWMRPKRPRCSVPVSDALILSD